MEIDVYPVHDESLNGFVVWFQENGENKPVLVSKKEPVIDGCLFEDVYLYDDLMFYPEETKQMSRVWVTKGSVEDLEGFQVGNSTDYDVSAEQVNRLIEFLSGK